MISSSPVVKQAPRVRIIVVTGMEAEAKLARAPGILVITGYGDNKSLASKLDLAIKQRGAEPENKKNLGILSFGIAGGLAPHLRPGTKLIARRVIGPDGLWYATNEEWSYRLASALPQSERADFAGVDQLLVTQQEKAALHRRTGALAVDMESHVAAAIADKYGLAFAASRVIADPAEHDLPHAAQVGLRADGKINFMAVARSILGHPAQIPDLWRVGRDTKIAFASLFGSRQAAGEGFGFLDFG